MTLTKPLVFSDEVQIPVLNVLHRELKLPKEQGTLLPLVPSNALSTQVRHNPRLQGCGSDYVFQWQIPVLELDCSDFFSLKKIRKLEALEVIILLG